MSSDVLVVDPGELGELLATLLLQHGLTTSCAKGGEQALEVALRERPGAIVIEYDLPDADGLDVAELLRDELGAKIVVTYAPHALSGADRDQVLERVRHFDAAFSRPFRSRELIQRVAELLGHHVARPETTSEIARPMPTEEEPLLLEEVDDEGNASDVDVTQEDEPADDDDLVVDVDVQHFADEEPPGPELGYGFPPPRAEEPPPPPFAQEASAAALQTPSGPREGVAVPISELEVERAKTGSVKLAELLEKVRLNPPEPPSAPEPRSPKEPLGERRGRLTPRALSDLLDAFHQSQTTGEIWLSRGQAQRVILLLRGAIVAARTNVDGERLVEEALLRRLLGEQTRRVVLGAFTWRDGTYRVTLTGHAKREKRRVSLSVADAILRGALLTETIEALREAAPDDVRFAPNPDAPYGLEQLTLSPDEARIVVALDGTKTMGDIATLYPELNERTRRGIAAGLLRLELLRFAGKGHAEPRHISFF